MNQVMVVDDDPGILNTTAKVLQRQGYEAVKAPNGTVCLELLRQGYRGVVLMDIMMPGLSGWDTIRAIVDEGFHERVLICMLTARATPGTDGEGLEAVVFDYLPKPFDNGRLLEVVGNATQFLAS